MLTKIATSNSISFMLNNKLHTFTKGQIGESLYSSLYNKVFNEDEDSVTSFLVTHNLIAVDRKEKAALVNVYSGGKVSVDDNGNATYKTDNGYEIPLPSVLVNKISQLFAQGVNFDYMVKFIENLMANPSATVRNELYLFLESGNIPITPDGCFLAYKKVDNELNSFHANPDGTKLNHAVGSVLRFDRSRVDPVRDNTCSTGLHFCSFSYLSHYWGGCGKVVILKINPKDVVTIPSDYSNTKGRACEYTVIALHEQGETSEAFNPNSVVFGENLEGVDENVKTAVKNAVEKTKNPKNNELENAILEKYNDRYADYYDLGYHDEEANNLAVIAVQKSSLGKKRKLTRDYIRSVVNRAKN